MRKLSMGLLALVLAAAAAQQRPAASSGVLRGLADTARWASRPPGIKTPGGSDFLTQPESSSDKQSPRHRAKLRLQIISSPQVPSALRCVRRIGADSITDIRKFSQQATNLRSPQKATENFHSASELRLQQRKDSLHAPKLPHDPIFSLSGVSDSTFTTNFLRQLMCDAGTVCAQQDEPLFPDVFCTRMIGMDSLEQQTCDIPTHFVNRPSVRSLRAV